MDGICRIIRIIIKLQLIVIISYLELDLINNFLNSAFHPLVTVQTRKKQKQLPNMIFISVQAF